MSFLTSLKKSLTTIVRCPQFALVIIIGVGFLLRFVGVDFGLPHRYHIDEPAHVVTALKIGDGDFLPVYPPNSPYLWHIILLFEYGIYFLFGMIRGDFHSPSDLVLSYQSDPTTFYLIPRMTSVVLGTLTIGLVYLIGRKIHGKRVGLLASLFFAFCFLHVRDSHFAVPDAFAVFLITLSAFFAFEYIKAKRLRDLLFAVALGGLATGVKSFLPGFVIFPLGLTPWLASNKRAPSAAVFKIWVISGCQVPPRVVFHCFSGG